MDRPIGRKVLKFDSRLWRLRVVVAAAPQIKEGARLRCRLWPPIGGGLCKRFPGLTGLSAGGFLGLTVASGGIYTGTAGALPRQRHGQPTKRKALLWAG